MTSITQQKVDLRAILHGRVEDYLAKYPDVAGEVAMRAVRLLSARMTCKELRDWHQRVVLLSLILKDE